MRFLVCALLTWQSAMASSNSVIHHSGVGSIEFNKLVRLAESSSHQPDALYHLINTYPVACESDSWLNYREKYREETPKRSQGGLRLDKQIEHRIEVEEKDLNDPEGMIARELYVRHFPNAKESKGYLIDITKFLLGRGHTSLASLYADILFAEFPSAYDDPNAVVIAAAAYGMSGRLIDLHSLKEQTSSLSTHKVRWAGVDSMPLGEVWEKIPAKEYQKLSAQEVAAAIHEKSEIYLWMQRAAIYLNPQHVLETMGFPTAISSRPCAALMLHRLRHEFVPHLTSEFFFMSADLDHNLGKEHEISLMFTGWLKGVIDLAATETLVSVGYSSCCKKRMMIATQQQVANLNREEDKNALIESLLADSQGNDSAVELNKFRQAEDALQILSKLALEEKPASASMRQVNNALAELNHPQGIEVIVESVLRFGSDALHEYQSIAIVEKIDPQYLAGIVDRTDEFLGLADRHLLFPLLALRTIGLYQLDGFEDRVERLLNHKESVLRISAAECYAQIAAPELVARLLGPIPESSKNRYTNQIGLANALTKGVVPQSGPVLTKYFQMAQPDFTIAKSFDFKIDGRMLAAYLQAEGIIDIELRREGLQKLLDTANENLRLHILETIADLPQIDHLMAAGVISRYKNLDQIESQIESYRVFTVLQKINDETDLISPEQMFDFAQIRLQQLMSEYNACFGQSDFNDMRPALEVMKEIDSERTYEFLRDRARTSGQNHMLLAGPLRALSLIPQKADEPIFDRSFMSSIKEDCGLSALGFQGLIEINPKKALDALTGEEGYRFWHNASLNFPHNKDLVGTLIHNLDSHWANYYEYQGISFKLLLVESLHRLRHNLVTGE